VVASLVLTMTLPGGRSRPWNALVCER
jgi:hypothetical protein